MHLICILLILDYSKCAIFITKTFTIIVKKSAMMCACMYLSIIPVDYVLFLRNCVTLNVSIQTYLFILIYEFYKAAQLQEQL